MNEIRDILVGLDFGKIQSQISYYDRKADEPLSVSMKVGTSQFEFPTCVCKRIGRGDWCFGREAEYFAKEHDGFLVEDLYGICRGTAPVQVGGEELAPWELMAAFLECVLKTLGTAEPVSHIKCLVITAEELSGNMVNTLQKACEQVGFARGSYILQDYSESFFYYILSQRPEYWSRNVAWFDFEPEQVRFRRLSAGTGTKPILVSITKPVETALSRDPDLRDMEYYQFISRTMGTDIYSSVFITGRGFHQEWATKSVSLLCKQKRKVFFGTNLFARGACYTARERTETHKLKNYLYAGDALVKINVGMDMIVMGSPAFHPLISAGGNWYESAAECELILDDRDSLVFTLGSMENGRKKRVSMALPGLASRPNRTTRLKLELSFQSPDDCRVTVRDLGFGEMFPSSGRVWSETIRWED